MQDIVSKGKNEKAQNRPSTQLIKIETEEVISCTMVNIYCSDTTFTSEKRVIPAHVTNMSIFLKTYQSSVVEPGLSAPAMPVSLQSLRKWLDSAFQSVVTCQL
jgi:hypothetical protein